MDWVILDGFDGDSPVAARVGQLLRSRLEQTGTRHRYFRLHEMNIAACRSCGGCGYKSPGKCVMADDIHEILRAVAPSDVVVFLSPIRFGGYSSALKKALERFMVLGMPYYIVWDGYLLHPMRYGEKALLSIGVTESDLEGQAEAFRLLVKRNARNLLCRHSRAVVVERSAGPAAVDAAVGSALEEALAW